MANKRRTNYKKKNQLKRKRQIGGFGPAAGIALGMALPMLLNTGTSVVGSIFGKKSAKKPAQSVNQPGPQTYRPAPPPSWMNDGPRRPRYNDYDYDY